MGKKVELRDVFKSQGTPTITYVERSTRNYESDLKSAILEGGQLCLLTGPSKIGKTTLYQKTLHDLDRLPIVVRCSDDSIPDHIWRSALEELDFERLSQQSKKKALEFSGEAGAEAKVGWKWLAALTGSLKIGAKRETKEEEIRERILESPSPKHLVPALKYLPITLVIEDFHYLSKDVQKTLFQNWKIFVDNEISVIVVGTTHHAVYIANSNKDLVGRIAQLDINTWDTKELSEIIDKGFDYLGFDTQFIILKILPQEAAGLPIIVQQVCFEILQSQFGFEIKVGPNHYVFDRSETEKALNSVARRRYGTLEDYYKILAAGPRRKARKYDTYEVILSCFTVDKLRFSLSRIEIGEGIERLPLDKTERPPAASINSTLGALEKFQRRHDMRLLEWIPQTKTLHIVEPSFLFYLR